MKIKTIGTGAISVKQRSACTLIDNKILVDCGNGIVKTLLEQNVNINEIDALLITHLHGDHFLDIPFLIMQRGFSSPENKLHIFCPKGTTVTIDKIFNLIYSDVDWEKQKNKANVEFMEFKNLDNKEISSGYFATSYNVEHGNFNPSYGYIIKSKNTSIGFSGDSAYCENIDEIIKNSNISILDMSFVDSRNNHMGFQDIEALIDKYNKPIIATHMSSNVRKYALDMKIKNLIIPNDGDEFEI